MSICVNLCDGSTRHFALEQPDWRLFQGDRLFQQRIRALILIAGNIRHSISAPRNVRQFVYFAQQVLSGIAGDAIGERIGYYADDWVLATTILRPRPNKPVQIRTDLRHIGRVRHFPDGLPLVVKG